MAQFLRSIGTRLKKLFTAQVPIPPPTFGQVMAGISVLGLIGIGYLYGAAVMFFQLPSYDFLDKAFGGARAWNQRGRSVIPPRSFAGPGSEAGEGVTVDNADKTYDGFTLYTMNEGSRAALIDMRGTEVHHWELPFSKAWPHPPHVSSPLADEQIHWFRCHLYPNGDVLAVYHADGDTPYGYGLVKLDKDSKLLWAYPERVHHDVDVGEDGTIYTLTQTLVTESPPGLEFLTAPYIADSLVVLSPDGKELENIPLLEAFAKSPYSLTLTSGSKFLNPMHPMGPNGPPPGMPRRPMGGPSSPQGENDVLHTNGVKVLSRSLAAKFPLFKAGQILLSVRNLDTIAMLDRQTRQVTWSAQGIWRIQHDAQFLDNGHLLLYDNYGSMKETRVLEYDPQTQAIPWSYANEDSTHFSAFFRGKTQRLPNGNTLIIDPDNRRLFEVTLKKELVWESFCPSPPTSPHQDPKAFAVSGARRYGTKELTFLKGAVHARP